MSDGLPLARRGRSAAPTAWSFGLTGALLVLVWLGGNAAKATLRYERAAVLDGQYWRLLTGHATHETLQHLLLNLAGLALIFALFPREYSPKQWLLIAGLSIAAIDVGFVFYEPQLQWYVGLSGVLHGALAAGAVAWWRQETPLWPSLLLSILIGKLAWEQLNGQMPLSGDMPVIVDAHLYGAIGGAAAGCVLWLADRGWPGRRTSL
jgi:rhomboid family GlyGly-CTERM serine protease